MRREWPVLQIEIVRASTNAGRYTLNAAVSISGGPVSNFG